MQMTATMKRVHLLFIICVFFFPSLSASTLPQRKAAGDEAYSRKDYVKAAQIYESILQTSPNSDVYYNLGNAYYRQKEIPKAILNYKRTLKFEPGDEDACHNLELCMTKIADRFDKPQEMFFITWARDIVHGHSAAYWGWWATATFFLFLLLIGLYLFSSRIALRKAGFFSGAVCIVLAFLFHLFAYLQQQQVETTKEVVLMKGSVVYTSPTTSSKKVRQLHEGVVVVVTDDFTKGWLQITMPDGNQGWLPRQDVEFV